MSESTCRVEHFTEFGEPIPITDRHEVLAIVEDTVALVHAELPPFFGALTSEDELGQLNLVAIVRDAGFGDVLMLMPTIRKIRALFPKLWIDLYVPGPAADVIQWATEKDDMLRVFDHENYEMERYLKTVDVSWFVERQPTERQGEMDRISLFASAFGIELTKAEKRWRLEVPLKARTITVPADKPVIAFGLESAAPHRAPPYDLALRIAKEVLRRGARLVFVGCNRPPPEMLEELRPLMNDVQIVAHESLSSVAAMIAWDIDGLICGDTGLYHLAGCTGTPFVALFGAIPPETRLVGYKNYGFVSAKGKLDCVPCLERPRHWRCQPNADCMQILDEKEIVGRAMKLARRKWTERCQTMRA